MQPIAARTTRPVADELFLLAHHEYTGKRHTSSELLGVGLAAAALVELVLTNSIVVAQAGTVHRNVAQYSGDPVPDLVLQQIAAQEPHAHPAAQWISYLRDDLHRPVADRLIRDNLLRETKVGLTRQVRYEAIDPLVCAMPRSRMLAFLRTPPSPHQAIDEKVAVLAGLMVGLGMWEAVPVLTPEEVRQQTDKVTARLKADLATIVAGVGEAKIALAQRPARG